MQNAFKRAWTMLMILASALVGAASLAAPASAHEETMAVTETSVEATAEAKSSISITGQLIELSSTDVPTTIVVRKNPGAEFTDYTVDVSTATVIRPETFAMSDWITGDFLLVQGSLNENTGVVTATRIQNLSINPFEHKGLNGWIDSVDASGGKMVVKWGDLRSTIAVTANTKMVVGSKNPAALSDFQVGDRVRLRLVRGSTINEARIIVALRRGDELYLKARTREFSGTLETMDASGATMTVRLMGNKHLRGNDVNNLVGVEGELVTVTFDANTKIVRKFDGEASVDEFAPGDRLYVVGRVGDDGVITARLIKNESIFKREVVRHLGKVVSIDRAANKIVAKFVRADGSVELRAQHVEESDNAATMEEKMKRKQEEEKRMRAEMEMKAKLKAADVRLAEEERAKLKARVDVGAEWTVTYTDATKFMRNGRISDENAIDVGDVIRVVGVANSNTKTVAATMISATSLAFKPLVRERPLKEIVKERMDVASGKKHETDIVEEQEPSDAIEAEVHADEETDMEAEDADANHQDEEGSDNAQEDMEGMEM